MFSFLPENFAKNFHNSCFAEHLSVPSPPELATVMCSVPVLESVLEYLYHYLQQTPTQMFSCGYCKIFKKNICEWLLLKVHHLLLLANWLGEANLWEQMSTWWDRKWQQYLTNSMNQNTSKTIKGYKYRRKINLMTISITCSVIKSYI